METLNLNEMNEIRGGNAPVLPLGMDEAQDKQLGLTSVFSKPTTTPKSGTSSGQ